MKALSAYALRILSALILASTLGAMPAPGAAATPSLAATIQTGGEAATYPTLGNPAAVYCEDLGHAYAIVGEEGQRDTCTLPDGQVCDAWAFLRGQCGQRYTYCAQEGYATRTIQDGRDPFSPAYAVCVTSVGVVLGSVAELSGLADKATGCGSESPDGGTPPPEGAGDAYVAPGDAAPPASFDWRSYEGSDWLTPIKNQGGCGSCWAFSAVGISEAAHNLAANNPDLDKDLSEQYLVSDCSSSGTCCGGYKGRALEYIRDYGIPDEGCMPYVDGAGCSCGGGTCDSNCTFRSGGDCSDNTCSDRCGDWSSRLETIVNSGYVSSDPTTIKQALVDRGPLAVSIGIGSSYGGYWDGDVYRCTFDSGTNHAVAIVGYDDAGGYWWVRNSWGTGWGEGGYFKLGYGECSVEQYVYYADARASDVGPLEYHSHTIDDDASGDSSGNGDGVVDCGETIELNTTLMNQGSDTATGVSATLAASDGYVSLIDETETYPDIPGGGTGEDEADYGFQVAGDTPDGHTIHFDLAISASNGGPWTDSFDVPVTCVSNNPPNTPGSPTPADGATDVSTTPDLSWTGGDPDAGDTVTYDVYFGTEDPPATPLCDDVASPTCDPGSLATSTQYLWYVVATDNHGASTTGPAWAFTTRAAGDAYEPDDTWAQASWIYDAVPQTHSIVPVGDVDWVTFTLSELSEVVIETSSPSGETRLELYDSSLNQLEADDAGSGTFSRIDRLCGVDALAAGTYYVKIDEHGNNSQIASYDVTFTINRACQDEVLIYLPLIQRYTR